MNAPTAVGSPHDAKVALVVGERIGDRYDIRGYLGEGGMGAVYRAYDAVLGEEVALKVVRGEFADQAALRDEVRIAQQVTHHNVCRTYDLEDIGGRHFIKMEYIQGETLTARIANVGRLPIATAVAIAREVAEGLAAAHSRGIAHRDLKPGNVMLCGDRVVLMDFGLARKVAEILDERAGTPAYMSPEQLAGSDVDERTDLFALGCLVYEMLVGERAFAQRGTFTELAAQRAEQRAPNARSKRRDTPRWLARAVRELLSPDPSERPKGKVRLVRGGSGRARVVLPVAAVALVGATALWLTRPSPPWQPAISSLHTYVGNADVPAISPDGTTIAYAGDPTAKGRWAVFTRPLSGGAPRQISAPDRTCENPRWTRDGSAILMRCLVDGERRIVSQPLVGASADLGPGEYVDSCGDAILLVRGSRLVRRASAGREVELARVTGRILVAVCDHSGEQVAFIQAAHAIRFAGGDLYLLDRQGHVRKLDTGVDSLAFTPGGRSIVFARTALEASQLFEIVLDTGREYGLTPDERTARAPDVSPDGETLLFHRDVTSQFLSELGPIGLVPRTFQTSTLDYLAPTRRGDVVLAERDGPDGTSIIALAVSDGTVRRLVSGQVPFLARDDSRVFFRANDDPGRLQAIPIAGGPVTVIGKLDGSITGGVDASDGQHVTLEHAGTCEGWLIPSHGRAPVSEGVSGLVVPAPGGGWRAVRTCDDGSSYAIRFVAPGQPLSVAAFERTSIQGRSAWIDDHHFAYCDREACRVVDVVDQVDRDPRVHGFGIDDEYAVAPEAMRWFTTQETAQVTLHKITNFDSRPWKP
jgi:predicted Ser/Thr protein kinase